MKNHTLYILLVIFVLAGLYCGWRYYDDVLKPEQQISLADRRQQQLFAEMKPIVTESATENETRIDSIADEILHHPLEKAEKVNTSVVGWITIPGTHIDYPIAQGTDNNFYLHNGFDQQYNYELGCPFLDYRCAPDFSGFNSIVYAHHMTKQRMFADIALYQDSSFMASCPEGMLVTKNGQFHVRFFAYLTVPSNSQIYQLEFHLEQERIDYIDFLNENANYTMVYSSDMLKENENLHLLLLSTCTYEFQEARGVLVGVIE